MGPVDEAIDAIRKKYEAGIDPLSGKLANKVFPTGAERSKDADGVRYDLISPVALERLAQVYKEGADKYGDFNWEKGMPVSDLLNHAIKHIYAYLDGDRTEDHLGHAAWNTMAAVHSAKHWPKLNDNLRPAYTIEKHTFNPLQVEVAVNV